MASRQNSWKSNTSQPRQPSREQRKCKVSGCKTKHCYEKKDEKKVYSKFCLDHTCLRKLPTKDGSFCSTHVANPEKGERFCPEHMICAVSQCRHTGSYPDVKTREDDTHPWLCPMHRCTHPNCKSGIDDTISKTCREHQICAAQHCTSAPDHDAFSQFCPSHTCHGGDGNCNLLALSDNRCRDHLKCGLASCSQPCHRTTAGRLEFLCRGHLATRCALNGCGRTKLQAHRRYCLDHGCRLPDCVGERHSGGGTLCAEHKCTFDDCFDPVGAPAESSNGRVQYLPLFCASHACRLSGCLYSRKDGSSYCSDHQCRVSTCANATASGPGTFCIVHALGKQGKAPTIDTATSSVGFEECRAAGCLVFVPIGGYCKWHSCVEDGCKRARLSVMLAGTDEAEEGLVRCFGHEREALKRDVRMGRDEVRRDGRGTGSQKRMRVMVEDVEDEGEPEC